MFGDSSETEMDIEAATTMETTATIDKGKKLQKVREKLLSNKTHERFTNYDGVMSDNNLSLPQKIIHLLKAIDDAIRRKITMLHYRDNYLKNAFFNQRKLIKKLWMKQRLRDSGRYFYENYTNLLWATVNFNFALFPYVSFTVTSR